MGAAAQESSSGSIDGEPLDEADLTNLGLDSSDELVVPSDDEEHARYFEEADYYASLVSLVKDMSTAGISLDLPAIHPESSPISQHGCRNLTSKSEDYAINPITIYHVFDHEGMEDCRFAKL